jgi:hypothetical protein
MYKLFYSNNTEDFCIRKKIGDSWYLIYKSGGSWSNLIYDGYIEKDLYKQIIDDQNIIEKIMIGLL